MGDLGDLVDEDDDIFLQLLIDDGEVVDEAEADDGLDLLAGDHGIHITARGDVLCDDGRACIAEA